MSSPCLSCVSVQVWSKSTNMFRRYRMQTMLIFTVFIMWWPSKLGQGYETLINSFNYPNDTVHKVWPQSIIWFKRSSTDNLYCQKLTFKVPVCPWKWSQGYPNYFFPCSSCVFCKFGQNPSTDLGDRMQTRLIFTVFIVWWHWKLSQEHENLIKS